MRMRKYLVLILTLSLAAWTQTGQPARPRQPLGQQVVMPLVEPNTAASAMTPEETLVRTAYAKFAYASEQGAIFHLANEAEVRAEGGQPILEHSAIGLSDAERTAVRQVSFQLSQFDVGNLADIAGRKAVDLIQPPTGEMLACQTPTTSVSEAHNWLFYEVACAWRPASGVEPEVASETFGSLLKREWDAPLWNASTTWERYAAYSVVVTFQGKSRGPYRALFVFGHDAKGNTVATPQDGTVDSIALATALAVPLFPGALLESRLRRQPVFTDWLSSHQNYSPTCSVGQGDVCCDLTRLQCGPGAKDVANSMAKSLPLGAPSRTK